MTVGFSSPVSAVGTQIQPLDFLGAFTGFMSVFTNDGQDATISVAGTSTTAEDNSAPFLGVVSGTRDITGVSFFADIGSSTFPRYGSVSINRLDVRTAVPEPGSALLVISAAFAMLLTGVARRRR